MATPAYDLVFVYSYTLAQICFVHRSSIHLNHLFVPNWPTLKGQCTYISPSAAAADLKLEGIDLILIRLMVDLMFQVHQSAIGVKNPGFVARETLYCGSCCRISASSVVALPPYIIVCTHAPFVIPLTS